ncbi:MAG: cobalt ECF transporter T component CbiQ [Anaerolineae bacterium]|nr:cobalt ECF transporter T component CbiQ [Anaerolineae bacterium]MDW8101958.1 cobalt ECF transporter T component CbiQ [Anaerolineae bacterium]
MKHGFIDKYSDLDSVIHRLDPRTKLVLGLAFILSIVGAPEKAWPAFGATFGLILVAAFLSRIPFIYILTRSAIIVPFVFLVTLFRVIPQGKEGFIAGAAIGFKAWLSALILVLLSATTPFPLLLKGMEKLKVPSTLVQILSFMYRYVFVVVDEAMRMERAWASRRAGNNWWASFRAMARVAGVLFIRSYERAERVYQAMLARGFEGEVRTLNPLKFSFRDLVFSSVSAACLGFIWILTAFGG